MKMSLKLRMSLVILSIIWFIYTSQELDFIEGNIQPKPVVNAMNISAGGQLMSPLREAQDFRIYKTPNTIQKNKNIDNKVKETKKSHRDSSVYYLTPKSTGITTKPLVIFLYSSSVRSGSTVFSEMVATKNNSVLLFEPFYPFLEGDYLRNISSRNIILNTSLNCNFKTSELKIHLKKHYLRTSHDEIENCKARHQHQADLCLRKLDIVKICNKTTIRIFKLVRGNLSDLEIFLQEPKIDTRIIHVTRDPRGTLRSVKKLGWLTNGDIRLKCKHLLDDLFDFDQLQKKYSDKVAKFSIEDFSIYPRRIAEKVFTFLYNEKNISLKTEIFIQTHMEGSTHNGNYNTQRHSQHEYQAWRQEINKTLLINIENEKPCQQAIIKLGHTMFGNVEKARNLSYSLFDKSYLFP